MRRSQVWFCSFFIFAASCATDGGETAAAPESAARASVFYAPPDRTDVRISPDGARLSFLAMEEGRLAIFIADADEPAMAQAAPLPEGRSVYDYIWSARGDRLIYMSGPRAEFDARNNNGPNFVLYSLDVETGENIALTPPLNRRADYRVSARHPEKVFISPSARDVRPRVIRFADIYTGELETSEDNEGLAPVYADAMLNARFATRWADRLGFHLYRRASPGGAWSESGKLNFADRAHFRFFGFDAAGEQAYYTHTVDRDRGALLALDLKTGIEREIAFREDAMITDILQDPETGEPAAWKHENASSWWEAREDYRRDINRLTLRLAGDISVVSVSADGARWVLSVASDTSPRRYYLYDRGAEPEFLFAESDVLAAQEYAPSRQVSVRTEDGFDVTGYLTLPPDAETNAAGAPDASLPMVVWLHGGPWDRVTMKFDPWSQWIAHQGYAALNVNFRGSIGFGKRFLEAHYGEWGGAMEDDIAELILKQIKDGVADPHRIAVMGESHGGYATMHFVANEPDIARCGVAISGLSDLRLFMKTLTDYRDLISHPEDLAEFEARLDRERMQFAADERTPEGIARLAAQSPITMADEIKASLLLVHGLEDRGVVPGHSETMARALDRRGADVAYLTFADEGHLIRKSGNWRATMEVTEAFLAECFGRPPPPIEAEVLAASTIAAPIGANRIIGLRGALPQSDEDENDE